MAEAFDTYNRRSRLYPGAIVGLPISALVVMIFAGRPAWWTALIAVLGASGATYFATQVIRAIGRADEPAMWRRWGGAPTTKGMRHEGAVNPTLVERRHRIMATLCPDEHLPTVTEERNDPIAADAVYETVVSVVRARTRDHKTYQLLFQENCSYGFKRNLLACKPYAYISLVISAVACVTMLLLLTADVHVVPPAGAAIVLALDVVGWLVMRTRVTEDWVHDAGNTYAERLFEAAEVLVQP